MKKIVEIAIIIALLIPAELIALNTEFYNINNLHGISIREANSICKDNVGFIWASSKTGILRLTEDDYRIYQLPYETADVISVKLAQKNKTLIAYTNNGQLFKYNVILDRFELLLNMGLALNNRFISVNRLLIDKQENLWISSSMGLIKYNDNNLELVANINTEVNDIEWYNSNSFFVARDNRIDILNTNTSSITKSFRNTKHNYKALKLYYDQMYSKIWIGTISDGLFYYDMDTKSFYEYNPEIIPKQPILAVISNSDSTIMIGVDGQGIWELEKQRRNVLNIYKESEDNPSSLRGNGVYDLFCDGSGRVWVCTFSGGVSYFRQSTTLVNQIGHIINNPNSLVNNDVNSIIEDTEGNIWFATNNGISVWNVGTNKWETYYHNTQQQAQVFLSLREDDKGRIWAGTYSSGFYVLDRKNGKELMHYPESDSDPFYSNFVFDTFKDSKGDIWIGGVQGDLVRYITNENRFQSYSGYPLYVIRELNENELLLGCTYGLTLLNKTSGNSNIILGGYLIYDVLVTNDYIWLGTGGDGLIKFDYQNNEIEKFTIEEGLPSNFVKSLTQADGYLWLGTEIGLCRFDPGTNAVQSYPSLFYLSNVAYNQNSHHRLKNGDLIWGTNNGAVIFNPSTIEQIMPDGKIYIQDLIVTGRSIRENSEIDLKHAIDSLEKIELNYTQNTITIEYLPLGMSNSKFSWKLEGHDLLWSQATTNRSFTYANIPNGDFTLRIRMYDSSLLHIIDEREIQISILPPFWQTWWFRSLILFVFISLVSFIMIYYVNQLKKQHSDDKIRFFANTAHDLRTSLTLISAPIEELAKEREISQIGKFYLNLASEQIKRILKVSTQLLDFQKADIGKEHLSLKNVDIVKMISQRKLIFDSVANHNNIKLSFISNHQSFKTAVDESMIEKAIDNLISNAIKYSRPNGLVAINLNCNNDEWILEVSDKGIGISKKEQRKLFKEFYRGENAINSRIVGSGIGLLLVKNYIKLHSGAITCISEENIGTTFRITVPIKNSEQANIDQATQNNTKNESVKATIKETNDISGKKQLRILIVEDNDDLRNFMQFPLQQDFQVSLAEDGKIAWKIIQKELPDLVVSDVMMPNMNGFELCKLMKSSYETSHIPIILLTALTEKDEQLHGLGLGADDYLTKPFDMGILAQRIKTIIKNRETIREKALELIKVKSDQPILTNELNDKFVKKALEVVQDKISDPNFGKEVFASEMNVSTSLLYKKIKSLTNQSPSDFIKTIRLNKALVLFKNSRITVTEVSELCGFTSVSYFSTAFKKHFGKSPTDMIE